MKTPSAKVLLIVMAVLVAGSAVFFSLMTRPTKVMTGEVVPNEQVYRDNDESLLAKKDRMRAMKVDSGSLFDQVSAGQDKLELELFDDVQFTIKVLHRAKSTISERLILQGEVEDKPNSRVVMTVSKEDLSGSIVLEDGTTYRLTPSGNGVCKVFEEDPTKLGACKDHQDNAKLQALGLPAKTDDGRKIGYAQQVIFIGSGGFGRPGSGGSGTVPSNPWGGGHATPTPGMPPAPSTTFTPPPANTPYGGSPPPPGSGGFYTPHGGRTTLRRLSPLTIPNNRPPLTVTNANNPAPPPPISGIPTTPSTYPPPLAPPSGVAPTTPGVPPISGSTPTNGHGSVPSGGAGTNTTVPPTTPGVPPTTPGVPPTTPGVPPTTPGVPPTTPGTTPTNTIPGTGTTPTNTQPTSTQPTNSTSTTMPPGSAIGNGTIDVLVLYTKGAAGALAPSSGEEEETNYGPIQTAIEQAMAEMTQALVASRATNARVRLVATALFQYASGGSVMGDLGYLRRSSAADALRRQYKADLVALVVTNNSSSTMGVGNYVSGSIYGNWQVCHSAMQARALSSFTLAHELGHNIGCMHGTGGGAASGNGPYPFSHGHRFGSHHTIMSYSSGGSSRIPYYSSPTVKYKGTPTGVAGSSDNAQSISLMAPYVSAYMPRAGGSTTPNTNNFGGGGTMPPGGGQAPPGP